MPLGLKTGLDCQLFRNTGSYASPVWVSIVEARDVKLNLEKDKADAASRGSRWKMQLANLKGGPIEFEILANSAGLNYQPLRDAFINDSILDMAVCDGPISGPSSIGNQYFRADYYVFAFPLNEPLKETRTVAVAMDLAFSTNPQIFVQL